MVISLWTVYWDIFRFTGGKVWEHISKKTWQISALWCLPSHLFWFWIASMLYKMIHWGGVVMLALPGSVFQNKCGVEASLCRGAVAESKKSPKNTPDTWCIGTETPVVSCCSKIHLVKWPYLLLLIPMQPNFILPWSNSVCNYNQVSSDEMFILFCLPPVDLSSV